MIQDHHDELSAVVESLHTKNLMLISLSPHDSTGRVLQHFHQSFPDAYQYLVGGVAISFPKDN